MDNRINRKIHEYIIKFKQDTKCKILDDYNQLVFDIVSKYNEKNTKLTPTVGPVSNVFVDDAIAADEIFLEQINDSIKQYAMNIIQSIYDYETFIIKESDYIKRKRVRNQVPLYERCIAKRANLEQCSRRKIGEESNYCGTHIKGTPYGNMDATNEPVTSDKLVVDVKIWLQVINGIYYHIDNNGNVYDHEDIMSNSHNPKIINKYKKDYDSEHEPLYSMVNV